MQATNTRLQAIADKKRHNSLNALFVEVQPTLEREYAHVIREVFAKINNGQLTTANEVYAYARKIS